MKIAVFLLLVTATACVVCDRPSFVSMKSAFPTGHVSHLKNVVGLPANFTFRPESKTAVRTSKAFIDLGLPLNHNLAAACGKYSYAGYKGSRGIYTNKEIFISLEFFYCYLRGIWGPPDQTGIRGYREIYGKRGLIFFTDCRLYSHMVLWKGNHCSVRCHYIYMRTCSRISMYYLP